MVIGTTLPPPTWVHTSPASVQAGAAARVGRVQTLQSGFAESCRGSLGRS